LEIKKGDNRREGSVKEKGEYLKGRVFYTGKRISHLLDRRV